MKKRLLAILLAVSMCLCMLPALAADTDPALCPHHTEHTDECGYLPPEEGRPCAHVHTDACWSERTVCLHTHGGDCAPAEGLPEGAAGCGHVCTEESGCVTRVLDCPHARGEHDDGCGFAEAVPGRPCGYVCGVCPVGEPVGSLPEENAEEVTEEAEDGVPALPEAPAERPEEAAASGRAAVTEQFPKLTPGETYYFDLSGAGIPGTVNTDVPDPTLHWVPFTYAGTVSAYVLTSRSADDETAKTDSENAANSTEPLPSGFTYDHSLLIADYSVTKDVSWNALNEKNLIFGNGYSYTNNSVGYKMRAPSAGSSGLRQNEHGIPENNEWDVILDKSEQYIKNCKSFTWGQDTSSKQPASRARRGDNYTYRPQPRFWGMSSENTAQSFRPVLELQLGDADYLRVITLNLNGGTLGTTAGPINIVAQHGFDAPGGEGLTPPEWKEFKNWEGSDGKTYAPGDRVLDSVTSLTAQWRTPLAVKEHPQSVFCSEGGTAAFTVNAVSDSPITYQWRVNKGNYWENISGANSSSYTVNAEMNMNGWKYRCKITAGSEDVTSGEAMLTVDQKSSSLTPGGTYWFDLSGAGIPGTENTSVPDPTLHWVPFTYTGTINAYLLKSRSADDNIAKTDSETAANSRDPDNSIGYTCAHSLLIADYNVKKEVSWDDLNAAGMIFGKNYTSGGVSYTMRAPSAGSRPNVYAPDNWGIPQSNEWDRILNRSNSYIKNWSEMYSWGQDTCWEYSDASPIRGGNSVSCWFLRTKSEKFPTYGFRPVLELQDPAVLTSGLQIVTLDLNGGKIGSEAGPVNIVVKSGESFTAPGGEGLTPPEWNEFKNWKGSDGSTYAPGESVPSSLTSLTAQWRTPLDVKEHPQPAFCSEGGTAAFTVEAVSDSPITYQWQVNKGNSWENISGANSSSYTVNAADVSMNGWEYRCEITAGSETVTSSEAVLTVDPKSSSLTPGGTYWFDLSGEGIPWTVNTSVPDTTLHWVPFTYTGTINAYLLKSRSADDSTAKTDSETAANSKDPNNSIGYTCAHSLLIADYNVTKDVSWNNLNFAGILFGKDYDSGGVSYTMRAPSAGSSGFNGGEHGIPENNEWDVILNKSDSYIKNWSEMYSWGQDTCRERSNYSPTRGNGSVFNWKSTPRNYSEHPVQIYGFRPVLELQDPAVLASGLQIVTLDLNGGKIGSEAGPVNIVVKSGESFAAPGGEGLTAPDGKAFGGWTASGAAYAAGAAVPAGVSALTALWPAAPAITAQPENKTVSAGQTAEFTVQASGEPAPTYQWQVSKNSGSSWEDISGATSSSCTTEAATADMNGWQYRCVVSNSQGNVTSDAATLTVNAPYQIAFTGGQADGPTQITLNAATVTPGGGTVAYAWNTANEAPADGWQTGLVFSGLAPGTTYYFFAKAAASGNYLETVSPGVAITTPAKSVRGIQIMTQPASLIYTSGQALDLSGLSVTVTYDDGTSETIDWSSGKLTASPAQGTALTVSEHDGNGVAISFGGKTASTSALTVTQGAQPPTKYLVAVIGGTGGGEYSEGASVTITATVPSGKRFTGWTVTAGVVTLADASSATTTFTMPAQAVTVTANFESTTAPTYLVTVNGGTGGGSYAEGASVTITATVPGGKRFTGWTVSAGAVTLTNASSATTTFTMPAQAVIVTANFKSNSGVSSGGGGGGEERDSSYAVAVSKAAHGTVASNRIGAGSGSTVTLTVTPDDGYVLDTLTVTDSRGGEIRLTAQGGGRYAFTMPARAVTVRAVFAPFPGGTACDGGADCPSRDFADLGGVGTWYHEAVDYVLRNNLMGGYGNGTFGPNDNLSRAQFAQILFNREGRPAVNYLLQYGDVPADAWCAEAIRWAASQGIVGGYGSGRFGPNDSITREQLAVMLWRYAGSPAATEKELHFTDADRAGGYALEALRWAVENGVMGGYGNGQLAPRGPATRAQIAQMLKNFLEKQA